MNFNLDLIDFLGQLEEILDELRLPVSLAGMFVTKSMKSSN